MKAAGEKVRAAAQRLLANGSNPVADIIKTRSEFYEWDHYPDGDVYDWGTHSQYFYHAHAPDDRVDLYGDEHGHFHTFLRPRGFPPDIALEPIAGDLPCQGDNDALTHLVAVSMSMSAEPVRLFTTNRWVTGEYWYRAADVKQVLPRFRIDQAYPSLSVNTWLSNLITLFRPTVEALIDARDARIDDVGTTLEQSDVFEYRELEVTSVAPISVDAQIDAVTAALELQENGDAPRQTG